MKKVKLVRQGSQSVRKRPALSPEAREKQLIALAVDCAEQQLIDGTASSQVITHYLKLGSQKAQREMEILESQNELLKAKTESLQSGKKIEEMYAKAMEAMTKYKGGRIEEDE